MTGNFLFIVASECLDSGTEGDGGVVELNKKYGGDVVVAEEPVSSSSAEDNSSDTGVRSLLSLVSCCPRT